jgi:hypothetical protein
MQDLRRLRIVRACDVLKILSSLPKSLNATYARILARIDPMYKPEALTALEWLVYARRPLFLEELAEASVVDRNSMKIIDPDRQLDPSDIADMLVGLVIVEPELKETTVFSPRTHVMSLAHFSVQEYLVTPDTAIIDSGSWVLEASLAHSNITLNCIAYIRYCFTCTTSNLSKPRPLESYALNRWAQHASFTLEASDDFIWETINQMFSHSSLCRYWVQHSRVFWINEEPTWDRNWIDSSAFQHSPYSRSLTSDSTELYRYYPLIHCIVHGLNVIVRYILDKSSPLLCFGNFPSTLETAVLLNKFDTVVVLLRNGSRFGDSLRLAFVQRNDAIAMELIRQGCGVKASDIILAAPWCSPMTMLRLLEAKKNLSLDDLALALNASLIGQKEVTKLLLYHPTSQIEHSSNGHSNLETVYEDLLITASRLGLSRTIEFLTNPAETLLPYHGEYDGVLYAATMFQHPSVIKSLLNSEAKSRVSYVSFATVVRITTMTRDFTTFRPLLRHIPPGTHSSGPMLRMAIACNHEPLAIRLLSDGAGIDDDGLWVDDISLLAAVLLQQNSIVKRFMLSISNFSAFCNALNGKGIMQDVCEILHAYGAKFAIHHAGSRKTVSPGIYALAKVHSLAASRAMDYLIETRYSLRRLVDIQSSPFRFTESRVWRYGSDNLHDFDSAIFTDSSPFPTGSAWKKPTTYVLYSYTSASTGISWELYPEDPPTTPWVAYVYNVDLINDQETAWEEMLETLPRLRKSVVIRKMLVDQSKRIEGSTDWCAPSTQFWDQLLQDMLMKADLTPHLNWITYTYDLAILNDLNFLRRLERSELQDLQDLISHLPWYYPPSRRYLLT